MRVKRHLTGYTNIKKSLRGRLQSMDKKIKHLEMIENVIERMARNCFTLKGWTMTLVALVGALSSRGTDKRFMLIGFAPIIVFWLLDSFYLQLERYRVLYRETAEKPEPEIDFKMGTDHISVGGTEVRRLRFLNCMFSFSEAIFYIPITAALGLLAVILILK